MPGVRASMLLRLIFWATLVVTVILALMPNPPGAGASDKFLHVVAFFVLTVLAVLAHPRTGLVWLGAGLSILGAAIEFAQMIPALNRHSEFADWIADTAAILVVLAVTAGFRMVSAPMNPGTRGMIVIASVSLAMVAAALLTVWQLFGTRPTNRPLPISTADSVDPLVSEMECVDRVLQQRGLRPEQVEAALARCRGGAAARR